MHEYHATGRALVHYNPVVNTANITECKFVKWEQYTSITVHLSLNLCVAKDPKCITEVALKQTKSKFRHDDLFKTGLS